MSRSGSTGLAGLGSRWCSAVLMLSPILTAILDGDSCADDPPGNHGPLRRHDPCRPQRSAARVESSALRTRRWSSYSSSSHLEVRASYPLLAIARHCRPDPRALGIIGSGCQRSSGGFATMSLSNALQFGFATVMAGASTYLIRRLPLPWMTSTTRRRLAGLAVVEERQRFS